MLISFKQETIVLIAPGRYAERIRGGLLVQRSNFLTCQIVRDSGLVTDRKYQPGELGDKVSVIEVP